MKTKTIILKHIILISTIILLLSCIVISNSYGASNDTRIKKIEVTPCIDSIQQDSENSSIYRVRDGSTEDKVTITLEAHDTKYVSIGLEYKNKLLKIDKELNENE